MSTKTKTSTQTTAAPASSTTISSKQYGWICPICGAVMSPTEKTCINRHDIWQCPPPYCNPWYRWYPYWYYNSDSITTSSTSINVDTNNKCDATTYTTTTTLN